MEHAIVLQDAHLILRPLLTADIPVLVALARRHAQELRLMGSPPDNEAYYSASLRAANELPFVITLDGEVVGATRFGEIRWRHRGLEIGWTWLTPDLFGHGVNARVKRLMLEYAFEHLEMQRVQFKTDALNVRSQRALEKLGAVREGALRRHMIRSDGTVRDTLMYSVTVDDWVASRTARVVARSGLG